MMKPPQRAVLVLAAASLLTACAGVIQPPEPKPDPQLAYVREAFGRLTPGNWIAFSPVAPKAYVYIFADTTCPYSQALHTKVSEFNAKGIEVRYLARPSGELKGRAWTLYQNIWCSDNPKHALDDAMKGKSIKAEKCTKEDILGLAEQQQLGDAVHVTATPTTFYQDGHWAQGVKRTEGLPERAILGAQMVSNLR